MGCCSISKLNDTSVEGGIKLINTETITNQILTHPYCNACNTYSQTHTDTFHSITSPQFDNMTPRSYPFSDGYITSTHPPRMMRKDKKCIFEFEDIYNKMKRRTHPKNAQSSHPPITLEKKLEKIFAVLHNNPTQPIDKMTDIFDKDDWIRPRLQKLKLHSSYKLMEKRNHKFLDAELLALICYTHSHVCCYKMKHAHRKLSDKKIWKKMYYHATNGVVKMWKVFHYGNEDHPPYKRLFHGSHTIKSLDVFSMEQLFVKTLFSFSSRLDIAKKFSTGCIMVIDNIQSNLCSGQLKGADVGWLSPYQEFEYIILPTTYYFWKQITDEEINGNEWAITIPKGINVYTTKDYISNTDPFCVLPDRILAKMQVNYSDCVLQTGCKRNNQTLKCFEQKTCSNKDKYCVKIAYPENIDIVDFKKNEVVHAKQMDIVKAGLIQNICSKEDQYGAKFHENIADFKKDEVVQTEIHAGHHAPIKCGNDQSENGSYKSEQKTCNQSSKSKSGYDSGISGIGNENESSIVGGGGGGGDDGNKKREDKEHRDPIKIIIDDDNDKKQDHEEEKYENDTEFKLSSEAADFIPRLSPQSILGSYPITTIDEAGEYKLNEQVASTGQPSRRRRRNRRRRKSNRQPQFVNAEYHCPDGFVPNYDAKEEELKHDNHEQEIKLHIINSQWYRKKIVKTYGVQNRSRRKILSLNKQHFIDQCAIFIQKNANNINLTQIYMFDQSSNRLESQYLFIVKIDEDMDEKTDGTDIAVSFKYTNHGIEVTGYHLNAENIKWSLFPQDLTQLNNFHSDITHLRLSAAPDEYFEENYYKLRRYVEGLIGTAPEEFELSVYKQSGTELLSRIDGR